jgi:L-ascorbate metabolism protein UlaG (beta-lactamase superfamily)
MHGHLGLTEEERAAVGGLAQEIDRAARAGDEQGAAIRQHISNGAGSHHAGGALAYLIETPQGSIFWQDTSGCWTGVLDGIECDVAILAAAGRGNVDGEPMQGSLAQFVAREAALLQPRTVILGHHDNWLPPVTREPDITPIREELARALPEAVLLEMEYLQGNAILGS